MYASSTALQRATVGFSLGLPIVSKGSLETLTESIVSFNKTRVTRETAKAVLLRLPAKFVVNLQTARNKILRQWQEYFIQEIESYSKDTAYSQLQWSLVSLQGLSAIFSLPLTFEQQIWLHTNKMLEKEQEVDLIMKIRESLLPWLNPQMFAVQEKRKTNVRTNVDYEVQRRKLISGTTIDEDDDLDIVL